MSICCSAVHSRYLRNVLFAMGIIVSAIYKVLPDLEASESYADSHF